MPMKLPAARPAVQPWSLVPCLTGKPKAIPAESSTVRLRRFAALMSAMPPATPTSVRMVSAIGVLLVLPSVRDTLVVSGLRIYNFMLLAVGKLLANRISLVGIFGKNVKARINIRLRLVFDRLITQHSHDSSLADVGGGGPVIAPRGAAFGPAAGR